MSDRAINASLRNYQFHQTEINLQFEWTKKKKKHKLTSAPVDFLIAPSTESQAQQCNEKDSEISPAFFRRVGECMGNCKTNCTDTVNVDVIF